MKIIFAIVLALLIAAAVTVVVFKNGSGNEVPTQNQQEEIQTRSQTETTAYGFSYSYPAGDDAYSVFTHHDAPRGDLVFLQSIMDTDDLRSLQQSNTPQEGPVSLNVSVYRNPLNLQTREWITRTDASNYHLSTNGTITTQNIGSTEFLTYAHDGLYRTDAYVFGLNGYIYVFSNMWENPESNMKKDMEAVLSTIVWSTPQIPAAVAHGDIFVTTPQTGAQITSPLQIEGEARGFWYFEASFPVVLVDWDGRIIAEGYAEAQTNWMTEAFVPFKAELLFDKPEGDNNRGALILRKDNPSGLPEHDDAIEVPIVFQ